MTNYKIIYNALAKCKYTNLLLKMKIEADNKIYTVPIFKHSDISSELIAIHVEKYIDSLYTSYYIRDIKLVSANVKEYTNLTSVDIGTIFEESSYVFIKTQDKIY